jgi:hypothetical protein
MRKYRRRSDGALFILAFSSPFTEFIAPLDTRLSTTNIGLNDSPQWACDFVKMLREVFQGTGGGIGCGESNTDGSAGGLALDTTVTHSSKLEAGEDGSRRSAQVGAPEEGCARLLEIHERLASRTWSAYRQSAGTVGYRFGVTTSISLRS